MSNPSVEKFYSYEKNHGAGAANRLLLGWLSDDGLRAQLYADMIATRSPLHFKSHAAMAVGRPGDMDSMRDFDWSDGPREYQQDAVLLVHPDHIEPALQQSSTLAVNATPDVVQKTLQYSNTAYRGLGGFHMLGLDAPFEHDEQRAFALAALRASTISPQHYDALATLAFKTGALAYLKTHEFDLTAMAESIAIRYVCMAFGFAQKDLALLEACSRKVGRGIEYQNMGRHFVFEPATMLESRQAVVELGRRATEIMALYTSDTPLTRLEREEKDELDTELSRLKASKFKHYGNPFYGQNTLADFVPILHWMVSDEARAKGDSFSRVEKGLIAAGLVGGAVANIQNTICIVIAQWMKEKDEGKRALKNEAMTLRGTNPDAFLDEGHVLHERIKEAMRVNPPAAFIPRRTNRNIRLRYLSPLKKYKDYLRPNHQRWIPRGTLVLIGVGGSSYLPTAVAKKTPEEALKANQFRNPVHASQLVAKPPLNGHASASASACPFAKSFGGPPLTMSPTQADRWEYTHSCPGLMMSMHVIDFAVRQLILLPSLSEVMNPKTRLPYGLEKRWGVQSTSYRMRYQREKWLVQTPLQTVLPIKTPVDFYSQQIRQVIRLGAPFIEKVLRDANHVHFASFMFMENDSKLVLFTMYDGDFDSYIGHFAREFSYLFDRFFSCIAVPPPMPIREHPDEFVTYLKQFVLPPVENYYFSAYPRVSTAQIVGEFARPGELDWHSADHR